MIAILICPNCEESSDVDVVRSHGATDLIPESCPECLEDWPVDILNSPSTEVYA